LTSKAQQWDRRVEGMAQVLAQTLERHWPLTLAFAFTLLLAGVFLAPLSRAWGWEGLARLIYTAGSLVCHQRPERSLLVAGFPAAVCARDTGILLGLAGAAWAWTFALRLDRVRAFPLWGLGLAVVPATVDGALQMLGLWESTNLLRLGTGMLVGGGFILYVFPHLARGFAPAEEALLPPGSGDSPLAGH